MSSLLRRLTTLVFLVVAFGAQAIATQGIPPVSIFEVPQSRGRGIVWAIAPSGDGRIWVGSDRLFLFDGESYTPIPLPSGSAIQGIARDDRGRVWVVGPGVIGWLEGDAQGNWRIHSLAQDLEGAGVSTLGSTWQAGWTPDGMTLVTDSQIIRWNGTRFEPWDLPSSTRLVSSWSRQNLWVYRRGTGVLRLEKTGPRLIFSTTDLPAGPVVWLLAPEGVDHLLVGTAEGVFQRRGSGWRFLPAVSRAVAGKLPVDAVELSDGRFAIGTYLGGIVIGSADDRIESVVNRVAGLPNDYVYTLCTDPRQNLWVGLEGALARIGAQGVMGVIDQRQGLQETPVTKIISHDGGTYALTSRALYDLRPQDSDGVTRSADFPGHLWDAAGKDKNLFLGGFGGIWRKTDGAAVWIHEFTEPSDVYHLETAAPIPGGMAFLDGHAIKSLTPSTDGRWIPGDLGADVGTTPLSEVKQGPDNVWVSTQAYGIFHFHWDDHTQGRPALSLVRHFRLGLDLPEEMAHAVLTTLGNSVYALSPGGIWAFVPERGRFEAVASLSGFAGIAADSGQDGATAYWIVQRLANGAAAAPALVRVSQRQHPADVAAEFLDAPGLDDAGRISALGLTKSGAAPTVWIGGSQALLRIDTHRLQAAPAPTRTLIRRVTKNDADIASLAPVGRVAFDPDTERLAFEFSSDAAADGDAIAYETRLSPIDADWLAAQHERRRTFTGMAPGDYMFQARTVDRFGQPGEPSNYAFTIIAPWYERAPAIAGYVLAAMLFMLLFVRWRIQALHRQTERLNQIVAERTRDLALANAAKNEFLETISHEIRNPLNGIVGLAEMLKDAPLRQEERTVARSLRACAESLTRVFEEVLGFSKLEYGYVAVEQKPFALGPLLEDVAALFTIQARQLGSTITVALPPAFGDGFLGDEAKLKTIVTNFVGNSLKYAPGCAVEIGAEVKSSEAPPDDRIDLIIRVSDQGPGIPKEEQKLIFHKFVRGAVAKRSGASGTGLGLATCRVLAELLGGKVAVESEPGSGAAFSVSLPLKRALLPEVIPASEPIAGRTGERALIIEDQDYNQIVLKGLAQKLGYDSDSATRLDEALALAETRRYAVVFLDWELPGPNGGEVAKLLRRHPHTRDSIIIATTAHDSEEIREKCRDAGMDAFALKPYSAAGMQSMLAESQGRRRGAPLPVSDGCAAARNPDGIDAHAFGLFAAGDPERAGEALHVYLETLDREIADLRLAVETHDLAAIGQVTHHIRSYASLVGDTHLNDAARFLREKSGDAAAAELATDYELVVARARILKSALLTVKKPDEAG